MKTGYKNMRCGLIGEHLGHSFSTMIHGLVADYTYEIRELSPCELEGFVRSRTLSAYNVTIPYKRAIMPYLDEISPEAMRIGAVNTVVDKDGRLCGYNTDYFGFSSMLDVMELDVKDKKVLILGNGGASLTARAVLSDRGARQIVTVSRSLENNYENIDRHYDAEVIVNTTPVGMYPNNGERLIRLEEFKFCIGVLDVIYNPSKTALLLDAERLGIKHINGLYMLVAQAVKAFEYFTADSAEEGIIDIIADKIRRNTENIIIVGMPGCGKSTVGRIIAKKTARLFFDADLEFEKMHKMTPAEAINTLGEEKFRELEHMTLAELGKRSCAVIATGGGAVTREENYAPLHQNGIIIYLRRALERLTTHGRPLSQGGGVERLYEARRTAYERFADITADSTEVPDATAELILALLEKGKGEKNENTCN